MHDESMYMHLDGGWWMVASIDPWPRNASHFKNNHTILNVNLFTLSQLGNGLCLGLCRMSMYCVLKEILTTLQHCTTANGGGEKGLKAYNGAKCGS